MRIYYTPPVLLKRHAMLATLNVSPPSLNEKSIVLAEVVTYEENY